MTQPEQTTDRQQSDPTSDAYGFRRLTDEEYRAQGDPNLLAQGTVPDVLDPMAPDATTMDRARITERTGVPVSEQTTAAAPDGTIVNNVLGTTTP